MKKILLFLLVSAVGVSAQTPVDYNQWEIETGKYLTTAGEPKQNYQDVDGWHEIDNTYINIGDSVLQCTTAIFQSRVYPNGVSEITIDHDGQEYVFTQQLVAIGLLNTDNQNRYIIDGTMNWSNISFDSNVVDCGSVSPGVKYKIIHENTSVAHQITYMPNFIDSLVTLLNQRPDSANISLVNLMKYTMSSNLDNSDSLYDDISRRKLKQLGRIGFEIGEQFVRFPGSDTLPRLKVRQYYKLISDTLFVLEAVPGNRIKQIFTAYPDSAIWHNTLVQDSIQTGLDDVELRNDVTWFPALVLMILGKDNSNRGFDNGLRFETIAVPQGSTIDSAFLDFFSRGDFSNTSCNVDIYCEDTSSAAIFIASSGETDFVARTFTTARVDWDNIGSWTNNTEFSSPDLKTIVQEVISRGDWSTGNDMVFFLYDDASDSDARRDYDSFENANKAGAAHVKIYYSEGGEPPGAYRGTIIPVTGGN